MISYAFAYLNSQVKGTSEADSLIELTNKLSITEAPSGSESEDKQENTDSLIEVKNILDAMENLTIKDVSYQTFRFDVNLRRFP